MTHEAVQPVLEALPPMTALILGGLVAVGVVLWLLGRSLARPMVAISGFVLGALGGLAVGDAFAGQGAYTLPLVIGGAIAGALLASLLFRLWMGLSAAVLLALVAPAGSIIWKGTPPPPINLPGVNGQFGSPPDQKNTPKDHRDKHARRDNDHLNKQPNEQPTPRRRQNKPVQRSPLDVARQVLRQEREHPNQEPSKSRGDHAGGDHAKKDASTNPFTAFAAAVEKTYQKQAKAVAAWWEDLDGAARAGLITAALVGAGAGLLLGLILPTTTAAIESALVGAILIFYPGRALLAHYLPDQADWLPFTPRAALIALGLLAVLGVLLQWTLFRKRRRE